MSTPWEGGDDLAAEDGPTPFTQVPDWILLSGCTAQAFRMYAFLAAHIDPRDPTGAVPCPKQVAIARAMGLSNERQVGPYGRELENLGALRREKYRYASGMRNGYRYILRFNPPAAYTGPIRMKDFYDRNPDVRFDPAAGRKRGAVDVHASRGTEISTPGGTEISTPGGTEKSTLQGPTDGTLQGAVWNQLQGAAHSPLQGTPRRSAEEDQEEADQEEAEPPPPPVGTAEDARGVDKQKGAASPRDLSPATAGGTAGALPVDGPAVAKSAPTEERFGHMASDVVRTLPRVLQPANDDEREALRWLIADKLSEGYPVGIVRQVLTVDPPEYVKSKTAFIGHRLDHMAPWVPPARAAADTAAIDEIRGRQAEQAGTAPPSAAAARAAFEAARGRGPAPKTQQGEAGSDER